MPVICYTSGMDESEWNYIRQFRYPATAMFVAGSLLLIFSAVLWYLAVFDAPRTVYDTMLERNLRTDSVVIRQVSGEIDGIKVDKRTDVQYGANALLRIKASSTIVASGTSVSTETVADTSQEYNRYTAIKTGEGGNPVDASGILNKWAEGASGATAYSETLLRPYGMPMGQLTSDARSKLVGRNPGDVFKTDYKVTKGSLEGRPTYTYEVRIQPEAYVGYLKSYAEGLNLHELDKIDPAAARQTPPIPVKLTVDVASRRLVTADYTSLGYKETFTDYNLPRTIERPKPEVSAEALQSLVTQL